MGKFDGSDLTIFNSQNILLGTGLYFNDGKITINDSHLTSHIQNIFSDLYIDECFKNYANCMYKIDKGLDSELTLADSSTRKISVLKDNTLYELDANQSTTGNQPKLCTKANKINNRYHIEFTSANSERMISQIDLNPGNNQQDIVNIFIVYKLNSRSSVNYWVNNGLFGHDNAGFDKFVCFGKHGTTGEESLMIAGVNGNVVTFGPKSYYGYSVLNGYKTNANAGELNKWICLPIHWDVPGGTNKSSAWCNKQKLGSFTARTSPGSTQMTFGDIDPGGIAPLDGSIAFFGLYKGFILSDDLIELHHKVLCNRYSIM